jgi:uncharacterized damage-inducible protein DinB
MAYDGKVLANVFKRNQNVILRQVEGLSHADSLLQPEARGNCLNFILGHILIHREMLMEILGLDPVSVNSELSRYERDSEPITEDGEGVLKYERLLDLLAQSSEILINALDNIADEELEREVRPGESSATVGMRVEFYSWHETYHVGQTEYLRQLAGVDDKVI